MATLRDIKRRITSVKNTSQITKAMKLVAAAKMRRAQENVLASRPYSRKLLEVLYSLAVRTEEGVQPLLAKREEKNILILLCSSDKGLCGAFNANLFRATMNLIHENEGKGIFLAVIGRKGRDFFKFRNVMILHSYVEFVRKLNYNFASDIGKDLVAAFSQEKVDRIYLVYNHFKSIIQQDIVVRSLLPVAPEENGKYEEPSKVIDYLYEPSAQAILSDILIRYVNIQIYHALLESWASENGARMAAMDNATRNAKDMIDKLTLNYNRARQSAITTELIEIISGAEAIKA
jgi:F-type H+-transporting ATPase subunit gamma